MSKDIANEQKVVMGRPFHIAIAIALTLLVGGSVYTFSSFTDTMVKSRELEVALEAAEMDSQGVTGSSYFGMLVLGFGAVWVGIIALRNWRYVFRGDDRPSPDRAVTKKPASRQAWRLSLAAALDLWAFVLIAMAAMATRPDPIMFILAFFLAHVKSASFFVPFMNGKSILKPILITDSRSFRSLIRLSNQLVHGMPNQRMQRTSPLTRITLGRRPQWSEQIMRNPYWAIAVSSSCLVAATVAAFGGFVCLAAQSDEPQTFDEAYAVVKSKVSQITSWTTDVQGLVNLSGESVTRKSRRYGKGDKLRIGMLEPNEANADVITQLVIRDAKQIEWIETRFLGETMVTKMNLVKARKQMEKEMREAKDGKTVSVNVGDAGLWSSPVQMMHHYSRDYDMKFVGMKVEDGSVFVFEGKMKEPDSSSAESTIRLTIGAEDGFLRRFESFTSDGELFQESRYTNIKLNLELDDDLFVYTPPKGVKVFKL